MHIRGKFLRGTIRLERKRSKRWRLKTKPARNKDSLRTAAEQTAIRAEPAIATVATPDPIEELRRARVLAIDNWDMGESGPEGQSEQFEEEKWRIRQQLENKHAKPRNRLFVAWRGVERRKKGHCLYSDKFRHLWAMVCVILSRFSALPALSPRRNRRV
jgi:hypothetical protein